MSDDLFAVEKYVIISARDRIDMSQLKKQLVDDWERLMPENTRLLLLAGIHGLEDGSLGDREDQEKDGFVEDLQRVIGILKTNKKNRTLKTTIPEDILKKNIVIKVEDVGQHEDRSELDRDKFTKAVMEFKPTVIVLAFCWSENSELNDILRSA